jgi:hypothetical protein
LIWYSTSDQRLTHIPQAFQHAMLKWLRSAGAPNCCDYPVFSDEFSFELSSPYVRETVTENSAE